MPLAGTQSCEPVRPRRDTDSDMKATRHASTARSQSVPSADAFCLAGVGRPRPPPGQMRQEQMTPFRWWRYAQSRVGMAGWLSLNDMAMRQQKEQDVPLRVCLLIMQSTRGRQEQQGHCHGVRGGGWLARVGENGRMPAVKFAAAKEFGDWCNWKQKDKSARRYCNRQTKSDELHRQERRKKDWTVDKNLGSPTNEQAFFLTLPTNMLVVLYSTDQSQFEFHCGVGISGLQWWRACDSACKAFYHFARTIWPTWMDLHDGPCTAHLNRRPWASKPRSKCIFFQNSL
jgi:hypothetical protein